MGSEDPRRVVLVGLPFDAGSSYLRGAAGAPAKIRAALHSPSTNLVTESGLDLGVEPRLRDHGDLDLDDATARAHIAESVDQLIAGGERVLALGGDHSVTHPLVQAHARHAPGLSVIHLDAHPDLYDELDGDRDSHACAFARIMEEGLAARLIQVGIRTMNPHQRAQAERFGVEVVEMRRWRGGMPAKLEGLDGPLYLSLDLDVLDPAFAPGVSHPEPGGAGVRDVLDLIQNLGGPLIGADVVELNPRCDPSGITARVAAKLVKEIAERLLAS